MGTRKSSKPKAWSLPPVDATGCMKCRLLTVDADAWAAHKDGARCLSPEAAGLVESRTVEGRVVWAVGRRG